MNLREMISFQQVAYYKSFSKAAKKLYFSQPTITFHILELEKEIGGKLFIRTNSHVELTPLGEILLQYVEQIITVYNEAIEAMENYKNGNIGNIKLALTGSTGYWLFPLLDKFKKCNKNVNIDLHVSFYSTILNLIMTKKAHFGFIKTESPSFSHPLLFSRTLAMDESILVFSPKHRFSQLEETTQAEVSREPIIAYGSKTNFWEQIIVKFNENGLDLKISADAYDYQTVKILLQTSFGVAFLPKICVNDELESGIIKTIPIKDLAPVNRYSVLIYRKDMVINGLFEEFLKIFKLTSLIKNTK